MGAVIQSLCLSVSALVGLALLGAVILDVWRGAQIAWPPRDAAHQVQTTWAFRAMVYPLLITSLLHLVLRDSVPPNVVTLVGGILIGTGLIAAFAATMQMGWHNAFGAGETLVTTGWFRLCRHPVYASSFVFLIGWALVAWNISIAIVLLIWVALYIIAPKLEEPWLLRRFGTEYAAYAAKTPRFLPSLRI